MTLHHYSESDLLKRSFVYTKNVRKVLLAVDAYKKSMDRTNRNMAGGIDVKYHRIRAQDYITHPNPLLLFKLRRSFPFSLGIKDRFANNSVRLFFNSNSVHTNAQYSYRE